MEVSATHLLIIFLVTYFTKQFWEYIQNQNAMKSLTSKKKKKK